VSKTGLCNLTYMQTKKLGWRENQGIQKTDIKDTQRNRTIYQKQVPKVWKNYITELYDSDN
jgi:hypothetical protein